ERLQGVAFSATVHDDDILMMEVHVRGELVASRSIPDPEEYFGFGGGELDADPTSRVDGASLVAALGRGDGPALQAAFDADFLFASERHAAVVDALGLPDAAVGWGYRYLTQDGDAYQGPPLERAGG